MFIQRGILIFMLGISFISSAQETHWDDTTTYLHSANIVPIAAYDPDNGFRYGATINIFRIKKEESDSSWRPFHDNIFIRGYHSTKGNFQGIMLLESNSLIPKSKCFIELSAARDGSFEFFGVNGFGSIYNPNATDTDHPDFLNEAYYKHSKELYKFRFDVQKELGAPNLRLLSGITLMRSFIDHEPNQLIHDYIENKIVFSDRSLPNHLQINTGLIAEKRNNQFYCTKGYWHEAIIIYSSNLNASSFAKSVLTFRNYLPVRNERNILMSRISFQNTLFGNIPYELSGIYYDSRLSTDGIGGMFNLRGVPRNRMIANGFISLNTEFKRTFISRKIKRTEVLLEGSFFTDNYVITQKIHLPENSSISLYDSERWPHSSTIGLGGYIVLNRSGVISMNYSIPLVNNSHGGRLYIGAGFMF